MSLELLEKKSNENIQFINRLEFDKQYPKPINFGEIYDKEISSIDTAKNEFDKNKSRLKLVEEVYENYFKNIELGKDVFFNAVLPKKECIQGMLRKLLDRLSSLLNIDQEILHDIKLASNEAIIDFIEHEKDKENFQFKMLVSNNQIQFLIGDLSLKNILPNDSYLMPDVESERGRGIPMMAEYSDKVEARRDKEGKNYAFLLIKNLGN